MGREYPNRIRNYEMESNLGSPGEFIVAEWCPFNGIHCSYFEHATLKDLNTALVACKEAIEEGWMAPHATDAIVDQIKVVENG